MSAAGSSSEAAGEVPDSLAIRPVDAAWLKLTAVASERGPEPATSLHEQQPGQPLVDP